MPFTDNFTGTDGDDLETRTGWTRVDGAAAAAEVNAANQLKFSSTTDTAYRAPDAGNADHYAQAHLRYATGGHNFFPICIRVTDKDNWIGLRLNNGADLGRAVYKRVAATFTRLYNNATDATPRIYKLEGLGDDIILYRDGVSIGVVGTTTDHNTVTFPGLVPRGTTNDPVLDDWESTEAAAAAGARRRNLLGVGS